MQANSSYTTIPGLSIRRAGGGEVELFADQVISEGVVHQPATFLRMRHRESYGEMIFRSTVGEDVQVWYSEYQMSKPVTFVSYAAQPVLELHIPIAGCTASWWDGQRQRTLRPLQFDLEYAPFLSSTTRFDAGTSCTTLDLHYQPELLLAYANVYPALDKFLHDVGSGKRASLLGEAVRFISPDMHAIVRSLSDNPAVANAEDLAMLLLELVLDRTQEQGAAYTPKKEIDAVQAARALMEAHPYHAYTTAELSAYTGINASKLYKCFRELQGTTLFGFSLAVRMEHAKSLLAETEDYLQDIAVQCGYPEHANFTAAFKRCFGITPAQFRSRL